MAIKTSVRPLKKLRAQIWARTRADAWLVSLVPVAWLGWLAHCFVRWSDCILAVPFLDGRPTNQSTNQLTNHVEALARESPRVDSKEYEEAT
jgi:hypothetical protein